MTRGLPRGLRFASAYRTALLAIVAVMAAVVAGVGTASSSDDAGNTLVAFAVDWPQTLDDGADAREATRVICGVDLNGASYRLTKPSRGALFAQPAWAPDGRRLAFAARGSFDTGVAVVSLPRLSGVGGFAHAEWPSWAPNGARLASQSPPDFTETTPKGIWIGGVDGAGRFRLADGAGRSTWSPDGRSIAFVQAGDLHVFAADGSEERNLTGALDLVLERSPDWSPDGETIAFAAGRDSPGTLHVVDIGSGTVRALGNGVSGDDPTFSPSGDVIAFRHKGDIRIVGVDGSGQRTLFARWASSVGGGLDWQPVGDAASLGELPPCLIVGTAARRVLRGSRFDDVFYGSAWSETISGGDGGDLIFAGGGNDRITGGNGADKMSGAGGGDVIDGGSGADVIDGGTGADRLVGGPSRDTLRAEAGNDVVDVRDGTRDSVSCGAGKDTVLGDRVDRIGRDCEIVKRP